MTFLHVDLVDSRQRTLPEHKAWLNDQYGDPGPGWKPGEWIDWLDGKSYLPGWRVEVELTPVVTEWRIALWFTTYVDMGQGEPKKVGGRFIVNPHEVRSEADAFRIVDYALRDVHATIHAEAMKGWT